MLRGSPSLVALLGLVAMAGYQNRVRINEVLDSGRQARGGRSLRPGDDLSGGPYPDLQSLFGPGQAGVMMSGGLGDLVRLLEASGQGPAAHSWVSTEPNRPLPPSDLEQAIGDDLLLEVEQRTGLPRAELIERLATALPDTVGRFTPQGRLPTDDEAEQFLIGEDEVQLKEPGRGS